MRKFSSYINTPNILILSALALMMLTTANPAATSKATTFMQRSNSFTGVVTR